MAALYAALELAPHPVVVISPDPLGQGASSAWAQGGIAAAMDLADSPQMHAADTLRAGAGTVDPDIARRVTADARAHILALSARGTPFDRDAAGGYVLSREAAHSMARVVRVGGDQAGHHIMATLIAAVRATASIQVLENVLACGLEVADGRVTGVHVQAADAPSEPVLIRAPGVLLAGGGSAGLYAQTTNPPRIRGQVIGMAARAGAVIADAEFVQFHPTAIATGEDPAPLATEALRGEGAILINAAGERFMQALHPDAELAPRDIVARAIFAQYQAGNRPMLDTRAVLGARVISQFPIVASACARAGLDPVAAPIPVMAAAHYHMGGIATAPDGSTNLGNLWVCGEAGATGLHGANRLASNGLLEALVYARACAQAIMAAEITAPDAPEIHLRFIPADATTDEAAVRALRAVMSNHVGVVRDATGLRRALREIAALEAAHRDDPQFLNMTATATLIAAGAWMRRESRGAHYRADFPQPDPDFAHRSTLTLAAALQLRTEFEEPAP